MPFETFDYQQFLERTRDIYQLILSAQLQEKFFTLKIIFIALSILFVLAIIFFLAKTSYLKDAFLKNIEDLSRFKDFGQKKWQRKWHRVKKRLEKGETESHWKISLIEAAKILDEILQTIGARTGTLDDRLKEISEEDVSNLRELFEAHRVCQDIIRDPDYRLSKEKAKEVIDVFERTFHDLHVF